MEQLMSVNFTGLYNLKVEKAKPQTIKGVYISYDKTIKEGEKLLNQVKLNFDAVDDAKGNHLTDLKKAFKKSGRIYTCNPKNPNNVELHLMNYDVKDDTLPMNYSLFKLNKQPIALLSKDDLALYTQLAKITRELGEQPETTSAQKTYTNFVNSKIAQEAEYFINEI